MAAIAPALFMRGGAPFGAGLRSSTCRLAALGTQRRSLQLTISAQSREVINTEKAPGAVGPYSQAIKHGSTLYVSGQVPLVPGTKNLIGDDIAEQTDQALKNLGAILEAAGSSYSQVLKTTVLLVDMNDFATVNEVYGRYFSENPPARACFAVKTLPLGAKVEIEAVAAV
ncbi:2-iminobutanoate/2-iminopropanoate deaminase [Coccomyxa sp. Obi]|nr:2-iminobutanoate/2-iminopropanoate deaminase [Coccomyxa sp. Obi]